MFFFWFNTFFVDGMSVTLKKKELDKVRLQFSWFSAQANKDTKDKLFPATFAVELTFTPAAEGDALASSVAAMRFVLVRD